MIEAQKVKEERKNIVADEKPYKKKEVIFYSDGTYTYAKAGKKEFVKKVKDGDLSTYRGTSTATSTSFTSGSVAMGGGWHTSSHSVTTNYIHKKGTLEVFPRSYTNLKKFILPGTPGYEDLVTYKKRKHKGNVGMVCSFGGFVGGITVIATSNPQGSDVPVYAGLAMFAGSIFEFCHFLKYRASAFEYIPKAVDHHNGE